MRKILEKKSENHQCVLKILLTHCKVCDRIEFERYFIKENGYVGLSPFTRECCLHPLSH